MFTKIKLANGDEVVINANRIEAIEKADDDPTAYELHLGTRHYLINAAEYARLTSDLPK